MSPDTCEVRSKHEPVSLLYIALFVTLYVSIVAEENGAVKRLLFVIAVAVGFAVVAVDD